MAVVKHPVVCRHVLVGTHIPRGTGGDPDPKRYWYGTYIQEVLVGTHIPRGTGMGTTSQEEGEL